MKTFIFSDWDLDGVGCLLVYKWFHPDKEFKYMTSALSSCSSKIEYWFKTERMSYDEVLFFDLDLSQLATTNKCIDSIGNIIYDHHESHNTAVYRSAIINHKVDTSCTKLLFNIFSKKYPDIKLTLEQIKLISLIDDYDCYRLKYKDTLNLMFVYNSLPWDSKAADFIELFQDGFDGFSYDQQDIIQTEKSKIASQLKVCNIYKKDNCKIDDEKYSVGIIQPIITPSLKPYYPNELIGIINNKYKFDVVFYVDLATQKVSIRKSKNCKLNLSTVAQSLIDGGGHEKAAGGKITAEFAKFTKTFVQVK